MPTRPRWWRRYSAFGNELKQKGGVGLFYFSGHGTQIDGENYLLPVGGEYANFDEVKTRLGDGARDRGRHGEGA